MDILYHKKRLFSTKGFKNKVTLQLKVGDHSFRIRMGSLEKPCNGTLEQWTQRLDTLKEIALCTT
jgi:hypothetical protein